MKLKIDLPEDFIQEEMRCDYLIPASMKALWAVQLDLLAELDRVCKAHDLSYFAVGGTLLGAARHGGFIPWDDDIDVALLREDYEKLQEVAPQAFTEGYFLQTVHTDHVARGHLQLRREGTTCLTKKSFGQESHHGIFIDIYVWDALPDEPKKMPGWIRHAVLAYSAVYFPTMRSWRTIQAEPLPRRMFLWIIKVILGGYVFLCGGREKAYARFEKICQKYHDKNTNYVGDISALCIKNDVFRCERKMIASIVELPFEHTTMPCPVEYAEVLTRQFGNWREFVRGATYHGGLFFRVDEPYQNYDALSKKEFDALFAEIH